jgi:hypothetical protein
LDSIVIKTNQDEELLLENDAENEIVLLWCETNTMCLKTDTGVYMDGTCERCPRRFYRLYTIRGPVSNSYIPSGSAANGRKNVVSCRNLQTSFVGINLSWCRNSHILCRNPHSPI